jgi:spermidine synthase
MVHPAMTSHPNPEAVCVIGAGDGGIVREVLKHSSCNEVVHVELDEGVVEASKNFFPTLHAGCWEDPRVDLQIVDGRSYIEETKKQFDVIIMDMTDPFGPSTMLYTQEFFTAVKARLRDEHGLFVMHAESSITVPQTFQQIDNTLKSVWPEVHMCHLYIQMYSTLWSIAIAGDRDSVKSLDRNTLAQRLHARGVGGLHAYTPDSHHAMQAGFPFIDALREQAAGLPIITDAHSTFVSSCHVDGSDINELLNPED